MSGGTSLKRNDGKVLELPGPNGVSYTDRAKKVFNNPILDPGKKEKKIYELFFAEFWNDPHNQDIDPKIRRDLAEIYAVEQILSLNKSDI